MFHKFNKHKIQNIFNNSKSFIGRAYHTTKSAFHGIHDAVNVGKQIYNIISPLVNEVTGLNTSNIDKHVMKGVENYEHVRNKILDADNKIQTAYNRIRNIN